jgi:integrase
VSIRKRGARAYQVRVGGFAAQTVPTREAAEKLELDLKVRKALGDLYEAPAVTLADAIDGLLARIEATRGPSDKTTEFNRRCAKYWGPLRDKRLPLLRRAPIEDMIAARALKHPRSAKNELEFLKRVLRDAKGRGQRVDAAIFEIPPVKHRPREGRGLTVNELHELASWCPEHASRLVLVAGQVGCRQNVWFNLTDETLDLKARTMTIPAALAKRRREHRIYLTDIEVGLLREQLMARPAGTSLVFPTVEGKQWRANRFRDRVWVRAVEAAAKNDPNKRDDGSSVFDSFTFHLLRHTAASLMALAGMDPAVAAERLEHSDGGALFHKTYRHLYEREKREQAMKLETLVRTELDEEGTSDGREPREGRSQAVSEDGRYWARTSDPQLVDSGRPFAPVRFRSLRAHG